MKPVAFRWIATVIVIFVNFLFWLNPSNLASNVAQQKDILLGRYTLERFITLLVLLIVNHRQLPPIGAGRSFVDIINKIKPDNIESIFPKVSSGYAELTIKRRQNGQDRNDLQLSEWFSGNLKLKNKD